MADINIPHDVNWHCKLKCLIPIPFLFTVFNSKSNITKNYADHHIRILNNQQKLLQSIKKNSI